MWQFEHAMRERSWALPCQFACTVPRSWQVRHAAERSSGGVSEFFEKVRSGFGRSFTPSGLLMCRSLSPWQLVQVGVRASAITPCRVFPMSSTGYSSDSSWQRVHFASPLSTRSFDPAFAVSCACAAAASPKASSVACTAAIHPCRASLIGISLAPGRHSASAPAVRSGIALPSYRRAARFRAPLPCGPPRRPAAPPATAS